MLLNVPLPVPIALPPIGLLPRPITLSHWHRPSACASGCHVTSRYVSNDLCLRAVRLPPLLCCAPCPWPPADTDVVRSSRSPRTRGWPQWSGAWGAPRTPARCALPGHRVPRGRPQRSGACGPPQASRGAVFPVTEYQRLPTVVRRVGRSSVTSCGDHRAARRSPSSTGRCPWLLGTTRSPGDPMSSGGLVPCVLPVGGWQGWGPRGFGVGSGAGEGAGFEAPAL